MKYIYSLADRTCMQLSVAGGKGARLSSLLRLKYNVPDGFVVSTGAFRRIPFGTSLVSEISRELSGIRACDAKHIQSCGRQYSGNDQSFRCPFWNIAAN